MNVFIIDDHPTQIEGYKAILTYNDLDVDINFTQATNTEEAYKIITNPENKRFFDIILLDIRMPEYPEKNIYSGEDLGVLINNHCPKSKIIIITSHYEGLILYNLLQKIEPKGLLVKSDFDGDEFLNAFHHVYNDKTYFSKTVQRARDLITSNSSYLDSVNREIILLLSQGVKTIQLTKHLDLSISSIEKRKIAIRDYFGLERASQDDIVDKAKALGLV